ncbi:MarR family winged helix-turn-helix transcriptional regulator [Xanthomarina sp. F2636L]|uniref:MarR family winged helix-turn-helix transcriptional regulator n=1 Tax=Xanthomarina sp. F2636L TaxID=2996018 RepID=UPI00225E2A26|nr:MarR family winged helix-turn-helix transcriptional regulator [Xanthomarina sp. F2636L]MCX7550415.1 MarR family winged helix-turn-helix transcriptional regulator [Xanthomarina sp. F2636L]
MTDSIFNPEYQNHNTSSKIIVALERISQAFKVLLWEKAKTFGLSPIQIQILLFIAYHKQDFCNVSYIANEFNVTKPTVSDAVKALIKKGHIEKKASLSDSRSFSMVLTPSGKHLITETEDFANPINTQIETLEPSKREDVFKSLSQVIYKLNQAGILTVQRTCYGCKFYDNKKGGHYCNLLDKPLKVSDIRIDCPEFDAKNTE